MVNTNMMSCTQRQQINDMYEILSLALNEEMSLNFDNGIRLKI